MPKDTPHELLVSEAMEAIRKVIGDTSANREKTLESLDELGSEIELAEMAIKEDIAAEGD